MACSKRALAVAFVALASVAYAQPSPPSATPTTPLVARQVFEATPTLAPGLNASVAHSRAMAPSDAQGVAMLHGLYLESLQGSSLMPWAFYAELRTSHAPGRDGVAMYSRLRNEGAGWATAIHAEPIASGSGTTIGVNVEASPLQGGTGRVLAMNIQAHNSYGSEPGGRATDAAINMQTALGASFVDGIRFDATKVGTGLHFSATSTGTRAIWIEGRYTVGLDVGSNPIRMNAGTAIQLEQTGTITVSYGSGRIVFRNGQRVIGYLVTDGTASGGRLN